MHMPSATASGAVFASPAFDDHEQVIHCRDARRGLSAIIAVHNTRLGPALGGCRMWAYADADAALTDVLRLSRGMTYKNALAGLDLGGGKAVILADARTQKSRAMLEAFGDHVERLGGHYLTAEDVGMGPADLDIVATRTRHVPSTGASGIGDPSPYTAIGVFEGLRAAVAHRFGSPDLSGRHVVIQGVGSVGYRLGELLVEAGARLTVSDIHPEPTQRAVDRLGASVANNESAHSVAADVFAPCALGAVLNADTIPELGAPVVAGGANNQLATAADADRLLERGILYAPDYALNAGGVIAIAIGRRNGSDAEAVMGCKAIGDTLAAIFRRADAERRSTAAVADEMALERLQAAPVAR